MRMQLRGRTLDLGRPRLVGIVNVTPDSFSDGGQLPTLQAAVDHALSLIEAGAELLDVGGESTRPGAMAVPLEVEARRAVPVVQAICARTQVPVCIDTRRAEVARMALQAGAVLVNDTSGAVADGMAEVVCEFAAGWVLMHAPHAVGAMGWSQAAQGFPQGTEAGVQRVADDLAAMVARALALGAGWPQLAVDPGLGFGKTAAQNLRLLRCPAALHTIGLPVYAGPSRKSFLVAQLPAHRTPSPGQRQGATAAAVTAAVLGGAAFVRVHDVAALRQVFDAAVAIRDAG
ncbi:MAG: dihydropteroate synthase [Deltaproteobacteria bacterium]|nr:dihydropteroate synthase [Deltaproteobacteria bacterium]